MHRDARAHREPVDGGHHRRGRHVAAPEVAEVRPRRVAPEHHDVVHRRSEGESRGAAHGVVLQQHHAPLRDLAGQRDVLRSVAERGVVGDVGARVEAVAELRAQDVSQRRVDLVLGEGSVADGRAERAKVQRNRHLDVEARAQRGDVAVRAEHPVGLDETCEAPLAAQHLVQEERALVAPRAVHAVVRAHHRRDVRLLHRAAELREVHLAQRALVDGDVDAVPRVLDAVRREVLGAREHTLRLHAADERCGHGPEVLGVLGVRLLSAPPARVSQNVHRRREHRVGPHGADLLRQRRPHAGLQRRVPGRSAHHRHGKHRRGHVQEGAHATRSIEHAEARQPEAVVARHAPSPVEGDDGRARHPRELLLEGQRRERRGDARLDGVIVRAAAVGPGRRRRGERIGDPYAHRVRRRIEGFVQRRRRVAHDVHRGVGGGGRRAVAPQSREGPDARAQEHRSHGRGA